jgi:hypothetical protein
VTRTVPIVVASLVGALLVGALAGCATPDPEKLEDRAETVFGNVVDAASALDAAVLRTLEVAPAEDVACDEPEDARQTAMVATGTLAIEATERDSIQVLEAVDAELDPERWDAIRVDRDLTQRAWADDEGIVVAVTAEGSIVTLAVFTPCLA